MSDDKQVEINRLKLENEKLKAQLGGNGKVVPAPLPAPVYPELKMPDNPQAPNIPPGDGARPSCEGEITVLQDPNQSPVAPPPEGVDRIMIGIPMLDVKYEFFESFLRFWTQLNLSNEKRYEVGYHVAYRKPVHMAEEYLVNIAQHNKCTHLLLMDDDIYDVTKEDLDKLYTADRDVIGGVMHASKFPHAMCVFRRYNTERKVIDMPVDTSMYRLYEVPCTCPKCSQPLSHWDIKHCPVCGEAQNNLIQQADLIPFAFTLIKMSVFDKIKKPWFHCTTNYPTDSWFADRLIEAGMTEYGHMGVRLNHAGINDQTKPFYVQMGMEAAKQKKGVVELSPEQMQVHQDLLVGKMKEVEEKQKAKPAFGRDGRLTANPVGLDNKREMTLLTHGT